MHLQLLLYMIQSLAALFLMSVGFPADSLKIYMPQAHTSARTTPILTRHAGVAAFHIDDLDLLHFCPASERMGAGAPTRCPLPIPGFPPGCFHPTSPVLQHRADATTDYRMSYPPHAVPLGVDGSDSRLAVLAKGVGVLVLILVLGMGSRQLSRSVLAADQHDALKAEWRGQWPQALLLSDLGLNAGASGNPQPSMDISGMGCWPPSDDVMPAFGASSPMPWAYAQIAKVDDRACKSDSLHLFDFPRSPRGKGQFAVASPLPSVMALETVESFHGDDSGTEYSEVSACGRGQDQTGDEPVMSLEELHKRAIRVERDLDILDIRITCNRRASNRMEKTQERREARMALMMARLDRQLDRLLRNVDAPKGIDCIRDPTPFPVLPSLASLDPQVIAVTSHKTDSVTSIPDSCSTPSFNCDKFRAASSGTDVVCLTSLSEELPPWRGRDCQVSQDSQRWPTPHCDASVPKVDPLLADLDEELASRSLEASDMIGPNTNSLLDTSWRSEVETSKNAPYWGNVPDSPLPPYTEDDANTDGLQKGKRILESDDIVALDSCGGASPRLPDRREYKQRTRDHRRDFWHKFEEITRYPVIPGL